MTRGEMLEEIFQDSGIRNYGRWLQRERLEGPDGAGLEISLLFCAIHQELLKLERVDLFD